MVSRGRRRDYNLSPANYQLKFDAGVTHHDLRQGTACSGTPCLPSRLGVINKEQLRAVRSCSSPHFNDMECHVSRGYLMVDTNHFPVFPALSVFLL